MLLSATEFATAATMRPIARNANTPTESSTKSENGRAGSGMPQTRCASPMIVRTFGRYSSQPVTSAATSTGSGLIGATLKRRRIPASRSITARIPAPKRPFPSTPITSTIVTTVAAAPGARSARNMPPKAKKKISGNT
jgi:hypothetical protein